MKQNGYRALYALCYVFVLGNMLNIYAQEPSKSLIESSPTLHSVDMEGNTVFQTKELLTYVSLKPGGFFDENQLRFSQGSLAGFYRDKGYADVAVSTSVTLSSKNQIDCMFSIYEGPVYHVKSVRIEGNRLISDKVLKHQMKLNPGDPFSQTRIYDANKALFASGYLASTDIQSSTAPEHGMDVVVKVKERPTRYVKGGFGYGAETKERLSLGYEDRNFVGHARRFEAQSVFAGFLTDPDKYQTTILETSLAQPNLFDTTYEGQTGVSREWDKRQDYYAASTIWRSTVGKRFGKDITANLEYRYQGTALTHVDSAELANTPSYTSISAIGPNFTYDNTNDPFLPFYGWRVNGAVEKGLTWGVGDLNFYKGTARVGHYDTFFHEFTFFSGLQFGIERPDNPNDQIPIFERYFLGGANTVRGYQERDLGLKDNLGSPLGGDAFGAINLELRHRIYKEIFGVTFLDGGQLWQRAPLEAWPDIQVHTWNDLAYGTGVGLRLHTPVGAVRLELGYKLNPPGEGTPSFFRRTAVDFSLGEVF